MDVDGHAEPPSLARDIAEEPILQRLVLGVRRLSAVDVARVDTAGGGRVRGLEVERTQVGRLELLGDAPPCRCASSVGVTTVDMYAARVVGKRATPRSARYRCRSFVSRGKSLARSGDPAPSAAVERGKRKASANETQRKCGGVRPGPIATRLARTTSLPVCCNTHWGNRRPAPSRPPASRRAGQPGALP